MFSCYHGVGVVCGHLLAVDTLSVQLLPRCRCCLWAFVGSGYFKCLVPRCRCSLWAFVGSGYFKCLVVTTV